MPNVGQSHVPPLPMYSWGEGWGEGRFLSLEEPLTLPSPRITGERGLDGATCDRPDAECEGGVIFPAPHDRIVSAGIVGGANTKLGNAHEFLLRRRANLFSN
jgi:hypothetical protein